MFKIANDLRFEQYVRWKLSGKTQADFFLSEYEQGINKDIKDLRLIGNLLREESSKEKGRS